MMQEILFDVSGKKESIYAQGGEIHITDKHYLEGNTLAWVYGPDTSLEVHTPIITRERERIQSVHVNRDTVMYREYPFGIDCWVYSEKANGDVLKFEFGTDGTENLSFEYILNFIGWKEITLPYERGLMKGTYSEKMNYFRVTVVQGSGTVYFSSLHLCKPTNPCPLYNRMAAQMKNMPQLTRRGPQGPLEMYDIALNRPIFPKENVIEEYANGFETVKQKYFEIMDETDTPPFIRGTNPYEDALEIFESYKIVYKDGVVTGKQITQPKVYAKSMKAIARHFYDKGNLEDADKAILMWRHLRDQNTQINWYHGRGVGSALLMLRDELIRRGLLEEAITYLKKSYKFARIYATASKGAVTYATYEDTDVTGMDLPGTLVCILLMENKPEKMQDMWHLIYYIENYCLGYAPGVSSGYKPDGTAAHHGGYICQYEIVANYSLARVIYMLADTPFMIGEAAVQRFLNVLKTTFIMYNGVFEPFTICQYAFEPKKAVSVVEFAHMANALHSKELAQMYVTLAQCSQKEQKNRNYQKFLENGIEPIKEVTEHKTLSYVAAAFHRRKDWSVAVRGHSKYVYPMEIWPDETGPGARPGMRYTAFSLFRSFGFLEIMHAPEYEGGTNNGLHVDKGFDFCRWPGSTAVHVPLSQIKSEPLMIEDELSEWLLSDRAFVGGLDTEDKNGVFAMQLHGPVKYGLDSFEATKTYHFYDDKILCLGSGISSEMEQYPVETTLFQDFGTGAVRDGNILTDNRGNGYIVFDGADQIAFETRECTSRDVKDHDDTIGTRTFAVINHGEKARNAHYGYLLRVGNPCGEKERKMLGTQVIVRKQDAEAHIVQMYNKTNYVFFRKAYELEDKWISSVSQSCIVSVTENDNQVSLAVCDPDLRFYVGESEDYDLNRNKEEKSIYGRFWMHQESMPARIWIVVNHKVSELTTVKGNATIIRSYEDRTILEFICKDGLTNEVAFILDE